MAKVDAYRNTAADYDEIPELEDADFARGTWHIGDRVVGEAEGCAAMAAALGKDHEPVDVPGDVLAAFRAGGPDWRERIVAALRTAAGL